MHKNSLNNICSMTQNSTLHDYYSIEKLYTELSTNLISKKTGVFVLLITA
jgi:hypothetical protein